MRLHRYIKEHPAITSGNILVTNWIKDGRVRVNGERARSNTRIHMQTDCIEVFLHDTWVELPYRNESRTVVGVYKPMGYLTTFSDPYNRRCMTHLSIPQLSQLRYAGRLDCMSEGLLLMSDDGQYIYAYTHPSHDTEKVYLVSTYSPLSAECIEYASSGNFLIYYDSIPTRLKPVIIYPYPHDVTKTYPFLSCDPQYYWYIFRLKEGKKNQIRKMVAQFYTSVHRLIRIKHGAVYLTKAMVQHGYEYISYEKQGME